MFLGGTVSVQIDRSPLLATFTQGSPHLGIRPENRRLVRERHVREFHLIQGFQEFIVPQRSHAVCLADLACCLRPDNRSHRRRTSRTDAVRHASHGFGFLKCIRSEFGTPAGVAFGHQSPDLVNQLRKSLFLTQELVNDPFLCFNRRPSFGLCQLLLIVSFFLDADFLHCTGQPADQLVANIRVNVGCRANGRILALQFG